VQSDLAKHTMVSGVVLFTRAINSLARTPKLHMMLDT
jgi:hypothetical protein